MTGNPGGAITESRRDGKESRRDHNGIPEGQQESRRDGKESRRDGKESRRGHNGIPEGRQGIPEGYITKHNRTQLIAERLS